MKPEQLEKIWQSAATDIPSEMNRFEDAEGTRYVGVVPRDGLMTLYRKHRGGEWEPVPQK